MSDDSRHSWLSTVVGVHVVNPGALLLGAEYAGIFHDFLNLRCRALFSMDGYRHVSGGLNLISEF